MAVQRPAENNQRIDVLISFREMPGAAEQRLVHNFGGKINRNYNNFPVLAASLPEQAISALSSQGSVRSVELDNEVYAVGYTAEEEYKNSWGIGHIGADAVHNSGSFGESIKVAIIDSGVDYNHRDLKPNFVDGDLGYDFVENDSDPMDVYGHGTHVAGSVAAVIDDFGVVGVAPEVQLISLRILNDDGVGSESNTLAALDWILEYNAENPESPIRITNNSYGRGSSSSPLKDAFDNLEEKGVLNVAAAGNSGNPAGKDDSIIYPAKYNSVMAIGAVDVNNNRPKWSSTGPDLELVAPGVSVLSTWNSNESYANPQPICFEEGTECHYYKEGSGTSMASPHVAGTAALAWAIDNNLTNSEIRTHLGETAEYLGDPNQYGYGLVRADGVLDTEPVTTGSIEGTVDNEEGAVISGATVTVEGTDLSATTDGEGDYVLENVPTGDQEVTASADGYHSQTEKVTVEENENITQNFTLSEKATEATISIEPIKWWTIGNDKHLRVGLTLVDEKENAVPDATVIATLTHDKDSDKDSWEFSETTNSDGEVTFDLNHAPDGDYELTVDEITHDTLTWDGEQPDNNTYEK